MAPEKNTGEDVSIAVPEVNEGSSCTASRKMQGESSTRKETPRCGSNSFNEHASSPPSNKNACLDWTTCRNQTDDPLKDWTFKAVSVFEWILVSCSVAGLLVSFILHLNPKLWRCCVLVLVIVCGRHFMGLVMMRVKNSLVKWMFKFFKWNAHYSYYIYGLGTSVGVFLWFVLVLLTWYLLLDSSKMLKHWMSDTEIENFIRMNLITLVIVGALWVVKTFLVNKLSSSFQVTRYFDWIRNSLINQHILEVFDQRLKSGRDEPRKTVQNWIDHELGKGKEEKDQGVIYRLLNIDPEEVSAWTMEDLIKMIRPNRKRPNKLSSITEKLENLIDDEDFRAKLEYGDKVPELDKAADLIFRSGEGPINKKILVRLFGEEDATAAIQQINGQKLVRRCHDYNSENQINEVPREALKMWLAHTIIERRTLVQSINDMKSAIKELNELFSCIALILLVVIWALMVGLLTQDGLVLILSQIFLLTFVFGNTAKNAFEGIVFVFVKHPFDIGDLCLIDREEMVVERVNLFTTIFRKHNKDKVFYSNTVLSNMPIRNFYNGNVHTRDSLEFTIDWSTAPDDTLIHSLRAQIKQYLCEDQQKRWFPECDLVVKELEDEKKAKMILYVTCCNVNVHRSAVTMIWLRHELITALNRILRKMKIVHYEIRPQEVDRMKNTAKLQSTQETNQQSNESKGKESRSELKAETATD